MSDFEIADFMKHAAFDNHEIVKFFDDKSCGLRAIIAVHSTALGTALGGIRLKPYESSHSALKDVLRLSQGMSYKNALARLPLGGGKMVVIARPEEKNDALLLGMGRAVNSLGGRYICSVDENMYMRDLPTIHRATEHVVPKKQVEDGGRDPSPATALGTMAGIKAAVRYKLKTDSLKGVRIAIQGVGKVGGVLAVDLAKEGAMLYVADVKQDNLKRTVDEAQAEAVDPKDIHKVKCDVFAPCGDGGVFDDTTIPELDCEIVAGCANNQLADYNRHGKMLRERGILYAPDYVVNAGGVICVAGELQSWTDEETDDHIRGIASTLSQIFHQADAANQGTEGIADRIAKERIAAGLAKAAE